MTVTYLNNLEQGDFIPNCPFINPYSQISLDDASEEQEIDSDVEMYDVIILSQSCDLVRFTDNPRKIKMVLVCPYKPLSQVQLEDEGGFYRSRAGKKALKEGHVPGYHLLNGCNIEGFELPVIVVDFKNVFSVPIFFIEQYAEKYNLRLRLCSPYKEHLSQAFARFFMRVGLPIDIQI